MVIEGVGAPREWPVRDPWEWPMRDPWEWPVRDPWEWLVRDPWEWLVRDLREWLVKDSWEWPVRDLQEWPVRDSWEWPVRDLQEWPVRDRWEWLVRDPWEWPMRDPREWPVRDRWEWLVRDPRAWFPSFAVSLLPSPIPAFPCAFPQEPAYQDSRGRAHSCFLIPTLLVPRMLFPVLILSLGLAGAMEIQVPEEPVVALFGHDATLLCSFSPEANFSVAELSLIWQLTDTKRLVHGFSGGRDLLQDQGRGYANRTALFYDQLEQGNVSLLLRSVRIADEGSFTCFVRVRDYNSAAVTLQVAAPYSKPSVHLEPSKDLKPGDVAVVTCHASRGYPEASVLWQDGRGANLTANVTTSQVANEEGLFEVRSVLRVLVEPSVTYSCLVLNAVLRQQGHASVTITGQPLAFPAVALWVTVALAMCVVVLLGVLAFVCHQKIRESCREDEERAGPEERDEEGEEPKTALQLLETTESREGREQEID